jgi:uncharacterized protein YndB with AHSA1/START domain
LTMRHVREYPHPIERVWDAVSTTEHLDVWLLPASQIERREGGRCSFSWGSPVTESEPGTVAIFDPPRRVKYEFEDGGFIQFDLEALNAESTRLVFLQHFEPGTGLDPSDWPGGDQPAGSDTPWKPGFVAGFHGMLDQLNDYLSGTWKREIMQAAIDAVYADGNVQAVWEKQPDRTVRDRAQERRIEIYRDYIRKKYPR